MSRGPLRENIAIGFDEVFFSKFSLFDGKVAALIPIIDDLGKGIVVMRQAGPKAGSGR